MRGRLQCNPCRISWRNLGLENRLIIKGPDTFPGNVSGPISGAFNDSQISTVIVLAITSNLALAAAPGNLRISKSVSGLGRASVINVSQVLTIDRSHLSKRVKALPGGVLNDVNDGLRLSLGV